MNQKLFEFCLPSFPHCNFTSPDYPFYCFFWCFFFFLTKHSCLALQLFCNSHIIYNSERPCLHPQQKEAARYHGYVQTGSPYLMVFQWENIFGGQDRELETRLLTSSRTVAEDTVLLTASIQPNLVPPMAVCSSPLNLWRLPWMGPSSDVGVSGTWQSTPRSLCKPTLAFSTVKHGVRLHLSVSSWAALQRCFTQESLFSLGSSIRASPLAIAAFNLSAPWVAPWGDAHIEKVMLCKRKGFVNLGNFSWGPLYHMRKNNRVIFKYRNESIKIAKKSLAWAPAPNSSLLPSLLPSHHAWAFPCAY